MLHQEALANVARHARARFARLEIGFESDRFVLAVDDDVVGFSVVDSEAEPTSAPRYGLMGMQERAELIRARLSLDSTPGGGTHLRLEVPL